MPTLARTPQRTRPVLLTGAALAVLSVGLLFVQSRLSALQGARHAGVAATLPLAEAGANLRHRLAAAAAGLSDSDPQDEEIERLRTEVATLRLELAQAHTLAAERAQSGRLADGLPEFAPRARPAPVIAPVIDGRQRLLWIGRGRRDAIIAGQAVVGPEGLLGTVRQVHERHALVQLLSDPASRWGGEVRQHSELGIVAGTGSADSLEFRLERAAAPVQPGDVVETSGTKGSLLPAGIPIGTVTSLGITRTGERRAVLVPAQSVEGLRTVFVLDAPQLGWEPLP
ncbi:MAG: rod shape-determining protein MreC [Candidatus Sumerlaeia bacterium]|nr:rod shape-determining protein MreC [Candidatus Sumerlaeia bacterium]